MPVVHTSGGRDESRKTHPLQGKHAIHQLYNAYHYLDNSAHSMSELPTKVTSNWATAGSSPAATIIAPSADLRPPRPPSPSKTACKELRRNVVTTYDGHPRARGAQTGGRVQRGAENVREHTTSNETRCESLSTQKNPPNRGTHARNTHIPCGRAPAGTQGAIWRIPPELPAAKA
jgi:hypothetical protein